MTELARLADLTIHVPSPEDSAGFLATALGFAAEMDDTGGYELTVAGDYGLAPPRRVLTLVQGPELELGEVRFDVRAGGLKTLHSRLEEHALELDELPGEGGDGPGLSFRDADGVRVVCREGMARRHLLTPSSLRPRRLGHVNLKVPDAAASASFYREALGLRLSERVGELLFFLRVGSEHHNLGFRGGAERAGVHHVAFEVPGWEFYRVLCDHLAELGHRVEYGPGRHGPGHNLFTYVQDPHSGLRLELFADMAHIDDDESYQPIVWDTLDRVRTVNVWGPAPPQSFLE